jgi:hypothetical protein
MKKRQQQGDGDSSRTACESCASSRLTSFTCCTLVMCCHADHGVPVLRDAAAHGGGGDGRRKGPAAGIAAVLAQRNGVEPRQRCCHTSYSNFSGCFVPASAGVELERRSDRSDRESGDQRLTVTFTGPR